MTDKIEQKDKKLYEKIASKYAQKDLNPYCRVARKLRLTQSIKGVQKPIKSMLELGCGTGFTASYIESSYKKYLGVDYSTKLINYANKYNKTSKAQFKAINIKNLKTDEKYDLLLMIGVLHHVTDRVKVLKFLKKLLKRNAVLIANEPHRGNPFIQILRMVRVKLDNTYSADQKFFSENELKQMFIDAGYKVKIKPQGILTTPLAETKILPKFIGIPLVHIFKFIDPVIEKIIAPTPFRRLSWNMVIEARPQN